MCQAGLALGQACAGLAGRSSECRLRRLRHTDTVALLLGLSGFDSLFPKKTHDTKPKGGGGGEEEEEEGRVQVDLEPGPVAALSSIGPAVTMYMTSVEVPGSWKIVS